MKKISFFILTIAFSMSGNSQGLVGDKNYQYLDSVEQSIKSRYCNGALIFPAKYGKKQINRDLVIVSVLNQLMQKSFSLFNLNMELNKLTRERVSRSESVNGLLKTIAIIINGEYLRAELKLDCIDDLIIRKKYLLSSASIARCGDFSYRFIDINLFKNCFSKKLEFPVRVIDKVDGC